MTGVEAPTPPKEALLQSLGVICETLESNSGKKTLRNFTKPKLGIPYLSRFFRELDETIKDDLDPPDGCESTANTLMDIAKSFVFKDRIFSAVFYVEKLEDAILRAAGTNKSREISELKQRGLELTGNFKATAKEFESDVETMSEKVGILCQSFADATECLRQLTVKTSKKKDIVEVSSAKWYTLCEQTVNEIGFVVDLARRIRDTAELVRGYRKRTGSIFQKRKAPSDIVVKWKEGPPSPKRKRKPREALANIPKPLIDTSESHLIVYDRIAKLRKENEELKAKISQSNIDPEYVKSLRDKNYEYTEELTQLQEDYERMVAQAEARGIKLKL